MSEPIEDINPLDVSITPPQKVTKSGIKKLIDFFKKETNEPDIKQIETPVEEDPKDKDHEEDSKEEEHNEDDYDDDDKDDDDDDDDD